MTQRRPGRPTGTPGFARRSRGFTLLELLLAFVVFALSFATVLENPFRLHAQYRQGAALLRSGIDGTVTDGPGGVGNTPGSRIFQQW